ncbi:hypothetical protein BJX99DRAFT_261579 [Aspergillus californicus]
MTGHYFEGSDTGKNDLGDRSFLSNLSRRTPAQISQLFSNVPNAVRDGTNSSTLPATSSQDNTSPTNTDDSSIESSLFAPVTTNNTTVACSTASSIKLDTLESGAFRDAVILPKTKGSIIRVYPYSGTEISDDHHAQFRTVVDMFRKSVENDERLRLHVSEIDYMVKRCGVSPKESHPSIIVCCTDRVFRDLSRLLTSRHLTTQYYLPDPPRRLQWRNSAQKNLAGAHIPRFKIYFWRGTPPRTLLWKRRLTGDVQVNTRHNASSNPWSRLTMCGSKVTGVDGSCSTLACLVEIDSTIHGLTVGHAFAHFAKQSSGNTDVLRDGDHHDITFTQWQGEWDIQDDHLAVHDVEYESPEEDNISVNTAAGSTQCATANTDYTEPQEQCFDTALAAPQEQYSKVLQFMNPEDPNTPDLDWALVQVSSEQSRQPNFHLPVGDHPEPVVLHHVATQHPGQERDVLIIRSLQDSRPGILLRGSSFLGGINRPGPCEVWNIAFSGDHGLIKGDSGSLVIDRLTNEVYGYVVGLNPLGEAYMVPMVATLAQIKEASGADNVCLPNAPLLLGKMIQDPAFDVNSVPRPGLIQQAFDERNLEMEARSMQNFSHPAATVTVRSMETSTPPPTKSHISSGFPCPSNYMHPSWHVSLSETPIVPEEGIMLFEEKSPNEWRHLQSNLDTIERDLDTNIAIFVPEYDEKAKYKHRLDDTFCATLNGGTGGGFHCEYSISDGVVTPRVSWASFRIKEVHTPTRYFSRRLSIHVEWHCESGRQQIYIFGLVRTTDLESAKNFLDHVSTSQSLRSNPFVWHRAFAKEVVERYDNAYWMLRDLVQEQVLAKSKHKSAFPVLHDIARHLYHYKETIQGAEYTFQALLSEHDKWRGEGPRTFQTSEVLGSWLKTRQGLKFEGHRAHSLKIKSDWLDATHTNEINLVSNLISQASNNAVLSAYTLIKSVVVCAMIYLPGTFISGIFSMNFFGSQGNTFTASPAVWIYFSIACPLTIMTIVVSTMWQDAKRSWRRFQEHKGEPGAELHHNIPVKNWLRGFKAQQESRGFEV